MPASPSVLNAFVAASRPKTWAASICPVLIGTAIAASRGGVSLSLFAYALLFSLLIQVGTNYANDYYDFVNGADTEQRKGPARAVASGWISPKAMRQAAFSLFFAALCVSIPLVLTCGIWALCFVVSSIAFGILYTGGPKPLGYIGLGELLVFLYFGPVAVCGSYFVQSHMIDTTVVALSFAPGLLSCALLVINNLRDADTDKKANKRTLIVRFGKQFGAWEYAACVSVGLLLPISCGFFSPILLFPLGATLMRKVFKNDAIEQLLPKTALLLVLFTLLFCAESFF